jgi:secondary thiamine-phosphate synthase enzyme
MKTSTLTVQTSAHNAFVEITGQARAAVNESGVDAGMLIIFVPHTTAGITINENADPNVQKDMLTDLERVVPKEQSYYRHFEGNSASHLRTSVVGNSLTVIIEGGGLLLGTWQGIYLCEFDGPRTRRVHLKILPDIE